MTKGMAWHHVPTDLNPADVVSRGCTPKELLEHSLWANGPPFLLKGASNWPSLLDAVRNLSERRSTVLIGTVGTDISINCKFLNSFDKLQRVFAFIYRFISNCRAKSLPSTIYLTVDEISFGTVLLLRSIQQVHIAVEHEVLSQGKPCPSKSKLISLRPILSSEGLLRVGGRLQNASLDYEAKHPILLPKDHPVTRAIIVYYHEKYFHAGPQALLAALRKRWVACQQIEFRLTQHFTPQEWTIVDRSITSQRPGTKHPQCYIAVFVYFSTKAAHLEVVQDLTTDSFIGALRRFISLRGSPRTIWSDNATNFVGAKRELAELKELFLSEPHTASISSSCLANGIDWKFIPPRAPHFGGLWEAAVKSAKFLFYRVVENAENFEVLTPAHFLNGSSYTRFSEPYVTHLREGRLSSWQRMTQMQQNFWKRWSREYLSLLQERSEWRIKTSNIQIGRVVLLQEDNLPPMKGQLGCIHEVIPGKNGVVREAVVRTATGLTKGRHQTSHSAHRIPFGWNRASSNGGTQRFFQRLFVDFLGPYPRFRSGNIGIFIVLEHYTKFVFLKAVKKLKTDVVIKYMQQDLFHTFGVPETIVSDNGS
ncbi:uncharacterized protein LOC121467484 [Drosophila elegans]|uniref:uncharacterized protein LOC121467484 n=1 Tax=Drosophila elegans TaxID=30023 RepID=UPI001BC83FE5|nr:uncharacterized protein LOC121467484 [Drosophila elegans]